MSENIVKENTVVSITYVILDKQGKVIEQNDVAVDYVHPGDERMFPKIMQNLEGKASGESVDVFFAAEDNAFGKHDAELTYSDDLANVPPDFHHLGAQATFQNERGEELTMRVTRIEDGKIYLDGNHPLIGKDLVFRVTVRNIRPATEQECASGLVEGLPTFH